MLLLEVVYDRLEGLEHEMLPAAAREESLSLILDPDRIDENAWIPAAIPKVSSRNGLPFDDQYLILPESLGAEHDSARGRKSENAIAHLRYCGRMLICACAMSASICILRSLLGELNPLRGTGGGGQITAIAKWPTACVASRPWVCGV